MYYEIVAWIFLEFIIVPLKKVVSQYKGLKLKICTKIEKPMVARNNILKIDWDIFYYT